MVIQIGFSGICLRRLMDREDVSATGKNFKQNDDEDMWVVVGTENRVLIPVPLATVIICFWSLPAQPGRLGCTPKR